MRERGLFAIVGYVGRSLTGSGKSWIEGDGLCNQWENLYEGLKNCGLVYKNIEGTSEKKDQYIRIADYGFVPFSVVE